MGDNRSRYGKQSTEMCTHFGPQNQHGCVPNWVGPE